MLAMEEAIQKAGRAKYGLDRDISMIDRNSGAIAQNVVEIVEDVEDEATQMSAEEGAKPAATCCW